jgi:type I restriction enzyme R subunit
VVRFTRNTIAFSRWNKDTWAKTITILPPWHGRTLKESAPAKMLVAMKRILRKQGYPPDKQKKATETVMAQADLLSSQWFGEA